MFPGHVWRKLWKPFILLCCVSVFLGFILLELQPDIRPIAYFLFILGGLFLIICLLSSFMEWRHQRGQADTTGALSSARDNAAFEVPSYAEAVVTTQGPNSDLGEPPPYSTVIASHLQEEASDHLEGHRGARTDRRGRSEGSVIQAEWALGIPVSLQLQGHLVGPETPPLQSLPRLEPLTPPPAYEFRPSKCDIKDDNVINDDSVFYEEGWTPP